MLAANTFVKYGNGGTVSRIGNTPIKIPEGVKIDIDEQTVFEKE